MHRDAPDPGRSRPLRETEEEEPVCLLFIELDKE